MHFSFVAMIWCRCPQWFSVLLWPLAWGERGWASTLPIWNLPRFSSAQGRLAGKRDLSSSGNGAVLEGVPPPFLVTNGNLYLASCITVERDHLQEVRDTESNYCGTARPTRRNAWSCCCDLPAPLPVGGQPRAGIEEFLNGTCFQCSCPSASLVTVKKCVPTCCIHGGSPVTSWLMQESGWSRWEELRITLSLVVERKSETGLLGQSSEPQLWNWECATTSPAS